jgi:hypothetical protein
MELDRAGNTGDATPDRPAPEGPDDASEFDYPQAPPDVGEPQHLPLPPSAKLTSVDLVVCLLFPLVGVIAGLIRLIRGDPSAARMLVISGAMLLVAILFKLGALSELFGQ